MLQSSDPLNSENVKQLFIFAQEVMEAIRTSIETKKPSLIEYDDAVVIISATEKTEEN